MKSIRACTCRNRLYEEERLGVLLWAVGAINKQSRAEQAHTHTHACAHTDLEQGIQIYHSGDVSHMSSTHSSQYLAECMPMTARTDREEEKNKYQHTYQSSQCSKQSYPFTSPIFNRKIRWESWYADNYGSLSMPHLCLPSRGIVKSCNSLLMAIKNMTKPW